MSRTSKTVRLNKWIAEAGIASRRKADEMIEDGLVKINGKTTYELGVKINPRSDNVTVEGKKIKPVLEKVYIMFHKPRGVVTTLSDPHGRPTVADFFTKTKRRVFPVGRLDWDTEGLLLLTNDGDFANDVIHPSQKIPKTYLAKLDGQPTDEQLLRLRRGVTIVGGRVKAAEVERVNKGSRKYDWIRLVIYEGKNRQIRQMFQKIGFDVVRLKRESIGELRLGSLKKGESRYLTPAQIKKIFQEDTKKDRTERVKTSMKRKRKKTSSPSPKRAPKKKRKDQKN